MAYGYAGKLLFVDLTTGAMEEETPDDSLYRSYIGGIGLGAKVLLDRMPDNVDPLGPGEHARLHHGASHGDRCVWRRPVHGRHEVAGHRRLGGFQLRRHRWARS